MSWTTTVAELILATCSESHRRRQLIILGERYLWDGQAIDNWLLEVALGYQDHSSDQLKGGLRVVTCPCRGTNESALLVTSNITALLEQIFPGDKWRSLGYAALFNHQFFFTSNDHYAVV